MVYDAKVGFTLHVDEFCDAAVPSGDFDDVLSQVTETGIESWGDFELCSGETICFAGMVVRVVVTYILAFKPLHISLLGLGSADHEDVEDVFYDCGFLKFERESFERWEGKFGGDWRDEYSWRERSCRGRDDINLSTHRYA